MADVSSCAADLAAAAGGDMGQVTPALPQGRAPKTDPQCHSHPWTPSEGTDRPGQLSWAAPRGGFAPSNCSSWQGGSREGAGSGLRGMEKLCWDIKEHGLAQEVLTGTHTHRAGGKATCGGDFKESFQHFGSWRGQGCCRGTSSSHLGRAEAELSFAILV